MFLANISLRVPNMLLIVKEKEKKNANAKNTDKVIHNIGRLF